MLFSIGCTPKPRGRKGPEQWRISADDSTRESNTRKLHSPQSAYRRRQHARQQQLLTHLSHVAKTSRIGKKPIGLNFFFFPQRRVGEEAAVQSRTGLGANATHHRRLQQHHDDAWVLSSRLRHRSRRSHARRGAAAQHDQPHSQLNRSHMSTVRSERIYSIK